MTKDINKNAYDEATLTKLEIFEKYLLAWLPVFIQNKYTKKVIICDYCAGSGQNSLGTLGSPLRILNIIEKYRENILQNNITIDVILNELLPDKLGELKNAVDKHLNISPWDPKVVTISCKSEGFQNLFTEHYGKLQQQHNLLFIDQYGIKEVSGEIFQMLINLERTDFLFFISSSTIKRFAKLPEFREHLPEINVQRMNNTEWTKCHRAVLEYFKNQIPKNNNTKLYPFSLRKKENGNIYGLIFGSKHPLGVDKFLKIAWDKNKTNGDANFDIDNDLENKRPTLFDKLPEFERTKTKIEIFEDELETFIKSKSITNNREIYLFTLDQGHYPTIHAKQCVKRMKKEGKINYEDPIGFSYKACYKKDPKIIQGTQKWLIQK